MSRNEPHRRHRNSLRRRFFAPRFEATPSLRVAPLRDSLADEEATLFLSHPGRTAFPTTDWIYSPRMPTTSLSLVRSICAASCTPTLVTTMRPEPIAPVHRPTQRIGNLSHI